MKNGYYQRIQEVSFNKMESENKCSCCNKSITSRTTHRYEKYGFYLKQLYPNSKPGYVCLKCTNECKEYMNKLAGVKCICCLGDLGSHQYYFNNELYCDIYKELNPNISERENDKVCQSCYVKAKKILSRRAKSAQMPMTRANNKKNVGNRDKSVAKQCLKKNVKRRQVLKEINCACCRELINGQSLRYENKAYIYSSLFPGSPFNELGRVCYRCYSKAYKVQSGTYEKESIEQRLTCENYWDVKSENLSNIATVAPSMEQSTSNLFESLVIHVYIKNDDNLYNFQLSMNMTYKKGIEYSVEEITNEIEKHLNQAHDLTKIQVQQLSKIEEDGSFVSITKGIKYFPVQNDKLVAFIQKVEEVDLETYFA
jgi:predicted small metal-binding protein